MERLSDRAIEIINELHTERLDYNSEYLPLIDAAQKLNDIETVMGDYDLDRLRELVQADREGRYIIMRDAERNGVARLKELSEADREGRCVVLNTGYTETSGGKALKQAMYLCSVTNNEVTRYTADAIAEKLVREERFFEAVKERENDG